MSSIPRRPIFYVITPGHISTNPGQTGQVSDRLHNGYYLVEWLSWQDGEPLYGEMIHPDTMAEDRWMIFTDKDLWIRRMAEVSQPRVVVEGDDENLPQGGTAFNPPPVEPAGDRA